MDLQLHQEDGNQDQEAEQDEPRCANQPVLRGSILLAAVLLLSLGAVMFLAGSAGLLNFLDLEVQRKANLLKATAELSEKNLNWIFRVLGATGYVIANIGTLAVCAASGRRRVHSATAAGLSGLAAVACLVLLLAALKPKIAKITKAMEVEQRRYFRAYVLTGEERYISQIHLHNACCGLQHGIADFEKWGLPNLPSSCCGLISGNCTAAKARKLSCSQAVKELAGDDGLLGYGYFVWILGISCALLSGLLFLMLFSAGQDTVELLVRIRHRAEDKWRQRGHKGDRMGLGKYLSRSKKGLNKEMKSLLDMKKLESRDQELHRMLAEATMDRRKAAATGWKQMRSAQKVMDDGKVRQKKPAESPEAQLARKAKREAEAERRRVGEIQKQADQRPAPKADRDVPKAPPAAQGLSIGGYRPGNLAAMLEEKMKREAEMGAQRLRDLQEK